MEIKVRNVDPHAVAKIDEWAKKQNKSRQVYLKELLENATMLEMISESNEKMEKQLEVNTLFMEKVNFQLEKMTEIFNELIVDEE